MKNLKIPEHTEVFMCEIRLLDEHLIWRVRWPLGCPTFQVVVLGSSPSSALDPNFLLTGTLGDRRRRLKNVGPWHAGGRAGWRSGFNWVAGMWEMSHSCSLSLPPLSNIQKRKKIFYLYLGFWDSRSSDDGGIDETNWAVHKFWGWIMAHRTSRWQF